MNVLEYAWYAYRWTVYIRPSSTTDLDWFYEQRGAELQVRRADV